MKEVGCDTDCKIFGMETSFFFGMHKSDEVTGSFVAAYILTGVYKT